MVSPSPPMRAPEVKGEAAFASVTTEAAPSRSTSALTRACLSAAAFATSGPASQQDRGSGTCRARSEESSRPTAKPAPKQVAATTTPAAASCLVVGAALSGTCRLANLARNNHCERRPCPLERTRNMQTTGVWRSVAIFGCHSPKFSQSQAS